MVRGGSHRAASPRGGGADGSPPGRSRRRMSVFRAPELSAGSRVQRISANDFRRSSIEELDEVADSGDYTGVEAARIRERQQRKMSLAEREAIFGIKGR